MNRANHTTTQKPCARRAALFVGAMCAANRQFSLLHTEGVGRRWSERVSGFGIDYPTPNPGGDGA